MVGAKTPSPAIGVLFGSNLWCKTDKQVVGFQHQLFLVVGELAVGSDSFLVKP